MTDDPTSHGLVIVPAYNEAGAIASVVRGLRDLHPDLDVLVIDDGSSDDTAARARPHARVIRLPFNLGIGGAMQTGYRYAAERGYDVALQVDGDGQHPAEQIGVLLERLRAGDADLVIGSRFLEPSGYRQDPARAVGARWLGSLLRRLTGHRFTDCTSGFRAANHAVIEAFARWYPEDYPEPEVVLLLDRAGFRVVEVPVTMQPRRTGSTSIPLAHGLFYVVKVSCALVLDLARHPWTSSASVSVAAPAAGVAARRPKSA